MLDKGTDRSRVLRKEVDTYTWQVESSDLQGELIAAFLANDGTRAVFRYMPLRGTPIDPRYSRASGDLIGFNDLSSRLIRLPTQVGVQEAHLT
jgi:hypothetical protein